MGLRCISVLTTNVTAEHRLFLPQYEFSIWSWLIGFAFLYLGLLTASCAQKKFTQWASIIFGVILFIDETHQAHECFAEFSGRSPLWFISLELFLAFILSILWFKEKGFEKNDFKYFVIIVTALIFAITCRFTYTPRFFKAAEEIAELLVALTSIAYVHKKKTGPIPNKLILASFLLTAIALVFSSPIRSKICPRVERIYRKLSHF